MKTIIRKLTKVLLVSLMLLIPLGVNSNTVYADDPPTAKEIVLNGTYESGDLIEVPSGGVYIKGGDPALFSEDTYTLFFYDIREERVDNVLIGHTAIFYFIDSDEELFGKLYIECDPPTTNQYVTGIKCVDGDGTSDTPFEFEVTFGTKPVVEEVKFTIAPPTAEDEVEAEWDDDWSDWNWDTQRPYPTVTVSSDAPYEPDGNDDLLPAFWIHADGNLFVGTFEEDEYYYAKVYLRTKSGYMFDSVPEVTVSGAKEVVGTSVNHYNKEYLYVIVKVQCVSDKSKYQFTEASKTYYKGSNEDLVFVIKNTNGDDSDTFGQFGEFYIEKDGVEIELTAADFKVEEGSVKITLKSSFLDKQELGTYKIHTSFSNGSTPTASFTVANKPTSKPKYSAPKTGVE